MDALSVHVFDPMHGVKNLSNFVLWCLVLTLQLTMTGVGIASYEWRESYGKGVDHERLAYPTLGHARPEQRLTQEV